MMQRILSVRIPTALGDRVDRARGLEPTSSYVRRALEAAVEIDEDTPDPTAVRPRGEFNWTLPSQRRRIPR